MLTESKGYESIYEKIEGTEHPAFFVCARNNKQKQFTIYGQCIGFDLTYNLFKRFNIGERIVRYGLGIFTGISNTNSVVILGFCVMSSEQKEDFEKVFRGFFTLMGSQPQTIVTDEQAAIEAALESLKR